MMPEGRDRLPRFPFPRVRVCDRKKKKKEVMTRPKTDVLTKNKYILRSAQW